MLFPIFIIGVMMVLIASFFSMGNKDDVVAVGLVDRDQSEETRFIMQLLEESSSISSVLDIERMDETEAKQAIAENELAAYLLFPDAFIDDLYRGESVELSVVGNRKQSVSSQLVHELANSAVRHISVSQANILTIQQYAKQLGMSEQARDDFMMEQFQSYLMETLGKDQVLTQEDIKNQATASPVNYYGLSAWFGLVTVWLFLMYHFFYKEYSPAIQQRMMLYGVTPLQQFIARFMMMFFIMMLLAIGSFFGFHEWWAWDLAGENIRRVMILIGFYVILLIQFLLLIELVVRSTKLRLFLQFVMMAVLFVASGAVIPTIYFPSYIQDLLNLIFSYHVFVWCEELVLNQRYYADYIPLIGMSAIGGVVVWVLAIWKGRAAS
ncbi:ABC transporter ATP-binding protein [Gracilibacillus halophilus YIM-C55.5]|uniref:ABC transporter ATP-binding protein n=1 Tax=Gracilibacillus halophilus YIM-C55.5 TaxID=1308866 RepID=N4WJ92_9BACI|nr:ABC transporter ATP-binding protein [Gracilibacillus halophilus YIM-C55.5]